MGITGTSFLLKGRHWWSSSHVQNVFWDTLIIFSTFSYALIYLTSIGSLKTLLPTSTLKCTMFTTSYHVFFLFIFFYFSNHRSFFLPPGLSDKVVDVMKE